MEPLGTGITNVVLRPVMTWLALFVNSRTRRCQRTGVPERTSPSGICTGLLMDVVLVRCVAVVNK
ncbi:MAG: hypothetical protein H6592_05555 [Flavobacteriales bacterium]|nr:hypothetical protein [Flavobacteriales bacterium]